MKPETFHKEATRISSTKSWTLFEEPSWLDIVAPGIWGAVEVARDGRTIGRLPYVRKRKFGVSQLSIPALTPWLGPWIAPGGAKGGNELGHQHDVLADLIALLPQ